MKTILSFGIGSTIFAYIFFSFGNRTWDPMNYSTESTYWFGCVSGLGFIAGMLVKALELDKDTNDNNPYKF